MNIPGAVAKHAIITDECRRNKGDAAVIDEALERLRTEWARVSGGWRIGSGGRFHVVLVVERPCVAPAAKPFAPDAANVGELREAEKMLARISKQIIDSNSEDLSDWLETWTAQVFASPAPRPDAAAPSAADAGVVGRLVELEAIVAKLPKTADGVPVTPGMTLYLMPDRRGATAEDMMKLDVPIHGNYCWFSSCDTALAAAPDGKKGKDQ